MEAVYNKLIAALAQAAKDEKRIFEQIRSGNPIVRSKKLSDQLAHTGNEIPEMMFGLFDTLEMFKTDEMFFFGYHFHSFDACEEILIALKEPILELMNIKDLKLTHKVISDIIFIANEWSVFVNETIGTQFGEE